MSAEEPRPATTDPAALFAAYLEYYRERAIAKVAGLTPLQQREARLPSGWTPLELLFHLACMERRWFVWGFLGQAIQRPWEDSRGDPDGRWELPGGIRADEVITMMSEVGEVTRRILDTTSLDSSAATGGRFASDPPKLAWICFHVLQEYARHVGHLDIAVELAGGPTGE